ncbi:hypothetical protein C8Q76DRAFT_804183 [Earliella scabrosa]|nr:hypothetical protein C8Q76DRAFT_804183 [Earliella scabrosa]
MRLTIVSTVAPFAQRTDAANTLAQVPVHHAGAEGEHELWLVFRRPTATIRSGCEMRLNPSALSEEDDFVATILQVKGVSRGWAVFEIETPYDRKHLLCTPTGLGWADPLAFAARTGPRDIVTRVLSPWPISISPLHLGRTSKLVDSLEQELAPWFWQRVWESTASIIHICDPDDLDRTMSSSSSSPDTPASEAGVEADSLVEVKDEHSLLQPARPSSELGGRFCVERGEGEEQGVTMSAVEEVMDEGGSSDITPTDDSGVENRGTATPRGRHGELKAHQVRRMLTAGAASHNPAAVSPSQPRTLGAIQKKQDLSDIYPFSHRHVIPL